MKKFAFWAAALALVVLVASTAYGYSLNDRKWFSSSDATFYLNNSDGPSCCLSTSQQDSQIVSGINAWSIASHGGTTTLSGAKRDGVNVISWGRLGGTTLGVTNYISTDTSQSEVCSGNLLYRFEEVDVRFNNQFDWVNSQGCSGGFDLEGVSTHEFGHAVGLGHSSVGNSTMYPSIAACDFSKSSLASDDRNGYKAIYSQCN